MKEYLNRDQTINIENYFLLIASIISVICDFILIASSSSIDYYNPFDKSCTHQRQRFILFKDSIFLMIMLLYSIDSMLLIYSSNGISWNTRNVALFVISMHWLIIRFFFTFYFILGNTLIYKHRNILSIRLLSIIPNSIEILAISIIYLSHFINHFHYEDTTVTSYSKESILFPISLLSNWIWSTWWFREKIFNDQGGYIHYMVAGYYINTENGYEIGQRRIDRNNVMFFWLTPILSIGYQRQLELNDLTSLPRPIKSSYTLKSFVKALTRYQFNKLSKLDNMLNNNKSFHTNKYININVPEDYNLDVHNHPVDWFKLKEMSNTNGALYEFIHILYNIFGNKFITIGFIKFCSCLINFSGPILLGLMVDYIGEFNGKTSNLSFGIALVILLGASYVATAMLNSCYNVRCTILQTKINGMLSRIMFHKAMLLPSYVWNEDLKISDNQLITLMQVDVSRVANICQSVHDLWTLPFEIIIAFILLYFQVREAFFAGVTIIILVIPLNTYIANRIGIATKGMMKYKDIRVQIISEAIINIKSIKMLSWENIVIMLSKPNRDLECKYLAHRKYLDAICVFLWASMPVLVPFATFTTTVLLNIPLTTAKVFTTIALLNMLIFPMNAFPWVINGFVEAYVSSGRLMNILASSSGKSLGLDCLKDAMIMTELSTYVYSDKPVDFSSTALLKITKAIWLRKGQTDTFNKDNIKISIRDNPDSVRQNLQDQSDGYIIGPISLEIQSSNLVGIIGPVASGKTSLLLGLIHEICQVSGVYSMSSDVKFSYCPQIPVMFSGCSIRDNILMGRPYEKERYWNIIKGCGLDYDFTSKTFPSRDKSEIVQGGNNLSGGQKLRIGVARALYSDSKLILLDDPFSALDKNTSQMLMDYLTEEVKVNNRHRAILLTSHHVHLLKPCDLIIYLNDGKEICRGDYNSMIQPRSRVSMDLSNDQFIDSPSEKEESNNNPVDNVIVEDDEYDLEFMKAGKIESNVYYHYISNAGIGITVMTILFTIFMQASSNAMAFWLSHWVSYQDQYTDVQFIIISSIIVGLNIFFSLIRSFLFAYGTLKSSRRLYEQLLNSVLGASSTFLQYVTSGNDINTFCEMLFILFTILYTSGKLINRFGKDVFNIDDTLPFMLNIVLAQVFLLIGSFLVIIYSDPLIIVILLLIFIIYYNLQKFYRASSRELKRLDSIYKSPVYNIINECINNAVTIRVTNQLSYYEKKFEIALDNSLRVSRIVNLSTQWLNIRLQLLGAAVATSLALSSVLCSTFSILPVSAGLLGLSLSYSLTLVGNLNGLIGSFTETEKEMISVERVREYINLPNEYQADEGNHSINIDFSDSSDELSNIDSVNKFSQRNKLYIPLLNPTKRNSNDIPFYGLSTEAIRNFPKFLTNGEIILKNLLLRYQDNLSPALVIDDLTISPGDRVAIIGRTGSGKSSLLRILLNLHDYKGFVYIDNRDIQAIPKYILRSLISTIPQDPVLFTSSLRFNLDPNNCFSDIEILQVIELCGLKSTFNSVDNAVASDDDHDISTDNRSLNRLSISNISNNSTNSITSLTDNPMLFINNKVLNIQIIDGGRNLSQGQRQLICLARALLKKSKLILIDEATAAVDPITESLVYRILNQKAVEFGATVLCICHKMEGVTQLCNKVLELKDGRIVRYEEM